DKGPLVHTPVAPCSFCSVQDDVGAVDGDRERIQGLLRRTDQGLTGDVIELTAVTQAADDFVLDLLHRAPTVRALGAEGLVLAFLRLCDYELAVAEDHTATVRDLRGLPDHLATPHLLRCGRLGLASARGRHRRGRAGRPEQPSPTHPTPTCLLCGHDRTLLTCTSNTHYTR